MTMPQPSPSKKPQSCALFLFAHQDDEFAAYNLIDSAGKRGEQVICVYLTNGAGNPKVLSEMRNRESLSVLKKLGVAQSQIYFLGDHHYLMDGKLYENFESARQAVADIFKSLPPVQTLYFPAWEGGHQDHDITHLIGIWLGVSLNLLSRSFQFPLYHGYRRVSSFFQVMAPLPFNGAAQRIDIAYADRVRYVWYCLMYRSQWRSWVGLFPFVAFHYLFVGKQYVQNVSLHRIHEPPHAGELLYERRGFAGGTMFNKARHSLVSSIDETGAPKLASLR